MIIDTHAHLTDSRFADDLPDVIDRAKQAGVERIITCGYDAASSRQSVELSERFDIVFATVGVHPHDAKHFDEEAKSLLTELAGGEGVLAIGETGLDYHYDFSPRADQIRAFEEHIFLACELDMPLVVHSREANEESLQVLKSNAANNVRCVYHCFSGDTEFARGVLDRGCYIGVDGPITFKSSNALREVVEMCPLDRLLVETDCPYMTPVPHRGKRNEPAYVTYVVDEVARVKRIAVDEVAEATTRNARALFGDAI